MRITLVSLLLVAATPAFAEDAPAAAPSPVSPSPTASAPIEPQKKWMLTGLVGPAFITSTGGGNRLIFGGRLDYEIGRDAHAAGALGLVMSSMSSGLTVSGVKVTGTSTLLGAEYLAREAWGTGLFFGARVGLDINNVTVSSSTTSVDGSDTVFAFAPAIGYEATLTPNARLVLDISWLSLSSGKFQFPTGTVAHDSAAALAVQFGLSTSF